MWFQIGDGGDGGGIVLQSVPWGECVLTVAREVLLQFDDDLKLYAFKATPRGYIYVRLDRLSNKLAFPPLCFTSFSWERRSAHACIIYLLTSLLHESAMFVLIILLVRWERSGIFRFSLPWSCSLGRNLRLRLVCDNLVTTQLNLLCRYCLKAET